MKFICILILSSFPFYGFSQDFSAKIEDAYHQVSNMGESAYYTDLYCTESSGVFDKEDFNHFLRLAMEKEGIFEVSYINSGKTIRVAHLSYVEAETLKMFGKTICLNIQVESRQSYIFPF